MSDDWRDEVYRVYLSTHYSNLNRLDAEGYELAALNYARIWDRVLPVDRSVPCLDIGCGAGQFLYYLRARGFADITGIDISAENIELARQMGFNVIHQDALQFLKEASTTDKRYGLISALDVIEHLTKQQLWDLLKLAYRVLEDRGRMLIKTVNASSLIGLYGRYMDFTHEMAFSEEALRQVFLSSGFTRLEIVQRVEDDLRERGRRLVKRVFYWALYRLIEGRHVPRCIDFDITAVAWK